MVQKTDPIRIDLVIDRKNMYSCGYLAKIFKVSKMGAKKIVYKFEKTQSVKQQPGQGHKALTSRKTDARISREAVKNPTVTAQEIKERLDLNVSTSTIKRRLRKSGSQN